MDSNETKRRAEMAIRRAALALHSGDLAAVNSGKALARSRSLLGKPVYPFQAASGGQMPKAK